MNLYFLDANDRQHLVAKDIEEEQIGEFINLDLEARKPGFVSYYKRMWWDKYMRMWIDFGSHTEFYLAQDEKRALNVVEDE